MKKNNKKIIIILILTTIVIMSNMLWVKADINDSKIIKNRFSGLYAVYDGDDRVHLFYAESYVLNNKIAYCIEPGIKINTNIYNSTSDFSLSNLTSEQIEYIKKIGYYGYDYPGHQEKEYYLAAQELIWEYVSGNEVKWVTDLDINAPEYDISNQKNEILDLVNYHKIKPSFDGKTIKTQPGNKITLKDDNLVLENFELYSSDLKNVNINKNELTIQVEDKVKNYNITLVKKSYTSEFAILYYQENNQKLMSVGMLEPNYVSLNVEVSGVKLKVVKKDKDTGEILKRSNITFKIKNLDTNEYVCQQDICEFKTDGNGILLTNDPLMKGRYQLEEVDEKIDGYLWNNESLPFEINEDSELVSSENEIVFEMDFFNKAVYGKVEIKKIGEDAELTDEGYVYTKVPLEGVKFGLFAYEDIYDSLGILKYKAGTKISELSTNSDGYAIFDNLYLGNYYVQEIETVGDHILDTKKYYFELKYKDQYTSTIKYELTINNYIPKGELEFTKVDFSTGTPLPDTLIEIYNDKDKLIFSGRTDENGMIVIKELRCGRYYILEKEAPEGYILNEERMYFEIREDGEIVKATMKNEKVVVEVPNTGINDYHIIEIVGGLLIISGIGVVVYVKKKRKQQ